MFFYIKELKNIHFLWKFIIKILHRSKVREFSDLVEYLQNYRTNFDEILYDTILFCITLYYFNLKYYSVIQSRNFKSKTADFN